MLDLAAKVQNFQFDEERIDGGMEQIMCDNDQDMIVAMCYIAECLTFGREIELDSLDIENERAKILDTLLSFINIVN